MNSSVFVGGFPYETTPDQLAAAFRACGTVRGVKILVERQTGRSRGLGFVDMATEAEARAAIGKLNGSFLGSRKIFVSEARPQERPPRGAADKRVFVERRSGKDRRQVRSTAGAGDESRRERPPAGGPRRENSFERKKSWGDKPAYPQRKPWEKRPAFGGDAGRGKRPWGKKPASPEEKPWEKRAEAGGDKRKTYGGKKKWRPGGAGDKGGGKSRKFGGFGGRSGR